MIAKPPLASEALKQWAPILPHWSGTAEAHLRWSGAPDRAGPPLFQPCPDRLQVPDCCAPFKCTRCANEAARQAPHSSRGQLPEDASMSGDGAQQYHYWTRYRCPIRSSSRIASSSSAAE